MNDVKKINEIKPLANADLSIRVGISIPVGLMIANKFVGDSVETLPRSVFYISVFALFLGLALSVYGVLVVHRDKLKVKAWPGVVGALLNASVLTVAAYTVLSSGGSMHPPQISESLSWEQTSTSAEEGRSISVNWGSPTHDRFIIAFKARLFDNDYSSALCRAQLAEFWDGTKRALNIPAASRLELDADTKSCGMNVEYSGLQREIAMRIEGRYCRAGHALLMVGDVREQGASVTDLQHAVNCR